MRDDLINNEISFKEKDTDTILARAHNGQWWWDDDLDDFEKDEIEGDGVWAWTDEEIDLNVFTSIEANEWNPVLSVWSPIQISISRNVPSK